MKTAIVHDWLVTYAGAERVLEQMLVLYPDADVYSLIDFMPAAERAFLGHRPIRTSFLQRLPGVRRGYRRFLPLMPLAIEQFDLSSYELVVSSSYAVAKESRPVLVSCTCAIATLPCATPGISRTNTYERPAWIGGSGRGWHGIFSTGCGSGTTGPRMGSTSSSPIPISWLSGSGKFYRRDAAVIHPPVDIEAFTPGQVRQNFYVTASRMVPYKRMDLVVEAFTRMPHRQLVVIGDGPEAARVSAKAGPNVRVLGRQPQAILREHLQQARAFVFAAEEDFGIAPVEALACGTPVIAYGKGGALETVDGPHHRSPTGMFFYQQTAAAIQEAVEQFEGQEQRFSPTACRESALRFGIHRFRQRFREYLESALERFRRRTLGAAGGLSD